MNCAQKTVDPIDPQDCPIKCKGINYLLREIPVSSYPIK